MTPPIVQVRDLVVEYPRRGGRNVRILDGLSVDVDEGTTLGIVGESGSGKTTLIGVLAGLVRPLRGTVLFDGVDLLSMTGAKRRRASRDLQLVFQNPHASLNPRMRVADIVAEPLLAHQRLTKAERQSKVEQLLADVGVDIGLVNAKPPQLSGGQAQRIAIARALALSPRVLLLDEPTSSLDLSVQAQILNLLNGLTKQRRLTSILVSHDLSVIEHMSDRVAVMYFGQIAELGTSEAVFTSPRHPYTRALMASSPTTDPDQPSSAPLSGEIPSFSNPPIGCSFNTRCPFVMDVCKSVVPPPFEVGNGHTATCHLFDPERIPSTAAEAHGGSSINRLHPQSDQDLQRSEVTERVA